MLSKKAISPLIASVLLIAFAVTLGAIVLNFSQESTLELRDEASEKIERGLTCSLDLVIDVLEINNEKFICYNRSGTNNLEVIVENKGSKSAKGIRLFLLDYNDNPTTRDIIAPLGAHNRTKYNTSINETDIEIGGVKQPFVFPPNKVVISPIIEYTDSTIDLCTDNRIDLEEIEKCS